MILSDRTLREEIAAGRIVVEPFDVDVLAGMADRIDGQALFSTTGAVHAAVAFDRSGEPLMLHPGEFVLGSTSERVVVPDDLVARLEGKSSLGRLGLLIHSTAGYVDAGWDGQLTLELSNVASLPITLYPGMKIGQISFVRMTTAADRPYGSSELGSKYRGQDGPRASRYWENFE